LKEGQFPEDYLFPFVRYIFPKPLPFRCSRSIPHDLEDYCAIRTVDDPMMTKEILHPKGETR
jgi:hypothetical protein